MNLKSLFGIFYKNIGMSEKEELMYDGAIINEVDNLEIENIEKDMKLLIITIMVSFISIIIALLTFFI